MNNKALYSTLLVQSYIDYLRVSYPDLDHRRLLARAGITEFELAGRGHWLTQEQIDRFHECLLKETNNPQIARQAGRYVASMRSSAAGVLRRTLLPFLSPESAFWALEKLAGYLSRHVVMTTTRLAKNKLEITATPVEGVKEGAFQCENRLGMIEALPQIFTGQYGHVEHIECAHNGGQKCRYVVSWEPAKAHTTRKVAYWAFALSGVGGIAVALIVSPLVALIQTLILLLVSMGILYMSERRINKDIKDALTFQRDASDRLFREIEMRYNESLLVRDITTAVSSIDSEDAMLSFTAMTLRERIGCDRVLIMLCNQDRTRLELGAVYGYTDNERILLENLGFNLANPESQGIFYRAFVEQTPVQAEVKEEINAGRLSDRSVMLLKEANITSLVCIPIIFHKRSDGVLAIDLSRRKEALGHSGISLLVGIAGQIGIGLSRVRIQKAARDKDELFRGLCETLPDVICRTDCAGKIQYVNKSWETVTGYPRTTAKGKSILGYLRKGDQVLYGKMTESIARNKLWVQEQSCVMVDIDGAPHRMLVSAGPEQDIEGHITGIIGVFRPLGDISHSHLPPSSSCS